MSARGTRPGVRRVAGVALALLVALTAGCARTPEAKKAQAIQRGDGYFKQEKLHDAILEYTKALRIDAAHAHAMRQIALAHFQLGEMGTAFRFLLRAHELAPDDAEIRLKLGTLFLLGGRPAEAQAHAEAILQKDPKNLDAVTLLAGSATGKDDLEAAYRRLEGLRGEFGGRARYHQGLGGLHLRRGDAAAAERAFRDALAIEPASVEGHLALAGVLAGRKQTDEAEREFKRAAELAPIGSAARIRLADFYVALRRPDEAERVLTEVVEKAPQFYAAHRRLAELHVARGQVDAAAKVLDGLLKKNPNDLDGHYLRGRIHLARHELTAAVQELQRVLKAEPRFVPARYQLALAHLQSGNLSQARAELREALAVSPNFTDAALLLADVNLQTGALQPAIDDLEALLARQPRTPAALVLLGQAYLAKGNPPRALEAYRKFAALAPRDPRGAYFMGTAVRDAGDRVEARRQFEAAIAMAPGYVDPLVGLVNLSVAERQPAAALARAQKQLALNPKSASHHHVVGDVLLARRDLKGAEAAYLRALELEPTLLESHLQLGNVYVQAGQWDRALERLGQVLARTPSYIPALMLTGVIRESKGDVAQAREVYEKVLTLNPRHALANNNLAWLLSEHGTDKDRDRALQLAQTAKELAPDDPYASDTLAWILYRRGVHQRALALARESAAKLPNHPQVQYHLGLISAQAGDRETARKALTVAVAAPGSPAWKADAQRALAALK